MIDFHSHIIPSIDDGSKDFDMSLEMLSLAVSEGTKYICATSHYIPGEIEQDRDLYDKRLSDLSKFCFRQNIDINILPALELYMHPELSRLYRERKIWGINNTQYLLIEFPMQQFPVYTEDVLYELRLQGAVPVIAHPERNFRIGKDISLISNLVEQGALVQVNAGSLRGIYGKDIKKAAEKLIDMNLIHMVGSDAHDNRRRNAKIKEAYEVIRDKNSELYNWLIDNEKNIIEGLSVETLPVKYKNKRKGFFGLFK
ncbi:protein tyrosine phosphatase [Clostridium sp. SYSU_GA19001]|uniref:tyrosine-protein phosphatase n=1 Tax=Clostridium caldaquaticum TaxID=2940653 RepID=UPI002076FCBB|nr:CpsB/CapC family capsule biosynthesis tyrosine phosphatase [Clostridium caldaquaticum]MCM8711385.1 protein tyrosine phosphatase [Clostridium caldaquaticum]